MVEPGIKVVIADDDDSLRRAIAKMLTEAGCICIEARNGEEAYAAFKEHNPHAIVLDVMMPKMDGFQACEKIRAEDKCVPILFLSAKGDIVDKRVGFRMGGDDYLVKPFSEEELMLRLEALLRRVRAVSQTAASAANQQVVIGDLEIDLRKGEVRLRGEKIDLTPKESRIMVTLAERKGELFSREDIISAVWGEEYVSTSISIPVFIRKLREKFEDDPANPRYLHTVWGYGYRLEDET